MAGNNGDLLRPEPISQPMTMGNAHNFENLGQPAVWGDTYIENNQEKFQSVRGDDTWVQMPAEVERGHGKRNLFKQHEYARNDYLKDVPTEPFRTEQGLSQTRFHNGFYRRPAHKIKKFDENKANSDIARAKVREARTDFRREELRTKLCHPGDSNGILTGNYEDAQGKQRTRGRRHFRQVLSNETQIEGQIKLRQSNSRFHAPYEDWDYSRRQKLMTSEGIECQRKSSELGVGRAEIASHGTADNFSKSYYLTQARLEAAQDMQLSTSRRVGTNTGRSTARKSVSRQSDIDAVKNLPK